MLKTKAMRERDELRIIQKYKYALIRVRFPDGVYLQGTFSVYEKLAQVYEFVRSCLKDESIQFKLLTPLGKKFEEEDSNKTLYDMRFVSASVAVDFPAHQCHRTNIPFYLLRRLVPNTILIFVLCDGYEYGGGQCLKEEFLMLIQNTHNI